MARSQVEVEVEVVWLCLHIDTTTVKKKDVDSMKKKDVDSKLMSRDCDSGCCTT